MEGEQSATDQYNTVAWSKSGCSNVSTFRQIELRAQV